MSRSLMAPVRFLSVIVSVLTCAGANECHAGDVCETDELSFIQHRVAKGSVSEESKLQVSKGSASDEAKLEVADGQEGLLSPADVSKRADELFATSLGPNWQDNTSIEIFPHSQIIQAAGGLKFRPSKPKYNGSDTLHVRFLQAQERLRTECPKLAQPKECNISRLLIGVLVNLTAQAPRMAFTQEESDIDGVSAAEKWKLATVASAVPLQYWLYTPNSFGFADQNGDNNINMTELDYTLFRLGSYMAAKQQMYNLMDIDSNKQISREDLHTFLRAAVFVREEVPEMDIMNPGASMASTLGRAWWATAPSTLIGRLPIMAKVGVIVGLGFALYILHLCIFTGPKKIFFGEQQKAQA